MTNILIVWSLGGLGFYINGNLLSILAFRIRRHLFWSNMKPGFSSPANRSPGHSHTPLWLEFHVPPGGPHCLVGTDHWEFLPLMSASIFHPWVLILPSGAAWNKPSVDFTLTIWKWLSFLVFPRSLLCIPLTPTAPVFGCPEIVRFLWDTLCHPCPS